MSLGQKEKTQKEQNADRIDSRAPNLERHTAMGFLEKASYDVRKCRTRNRSGNGPEIDTSTLDDRDI